MKATFLGTGTSVSRRAGACIHVQTDKSMLFDFGPRSLWNMEIAKRAKDLQIFCPPGEKQVLESILSFPIIKESAFGKEIREISNQVVSFGSGKITVKEVKHDPAIHANAYRVEYNGKSLVYSGDSTKCQELIDIAKGADIAIFEAAHVKPDKKHMTPSEAAEAAEAAGVRKLVMTHLYEDSDNADIVSMARKKFSGEVIKAEDLMVIDV